MKTIIAALVVIVLAVMPGCGSPHNPCDGKACGAACNPCEGEDTCIHLTSSHCDKDGHCKDDNGYPPVCP
jgi:hypothetical protein